MKLSELLHGYAQVESQLCISGLTLDSRDVKTGYLFIAVNGSQQHGLAHIALAIANGAGSVVYDPEGDGQTLAAEITQIPAIAVPGLKARLGELAARYYGQPSSALSVIGITGTNGKTSCSQFLAQALNDCAVIGTLGWGDINNLETTRNTTPDAVSLQAILAAMCTVNKQAVAMEVSSHSLAQDRVNGVLFTGAVFTNITRDHLDYHGTMAAYGLAKRKLFERPELRFAVLNLDDSYSLSLLTALPKSAQAWGYSCQGKTEANLENVVAQQVWHGIDGIGFEVHWQQDQQAVSLPLYGDFNIENALAVLTVLLALGIPLADAVAKLQRVTPVTGRMQRLGQDTGILIFVDYAHTPDALDKVLASVRKHCQQQLWVVFGCGGDRDTGKRPQMGACAEHWANHVIVTDDNPRFEDADAIVAAILSGCHSDKVEVIHNRSLAINTAVANANPGDCVVIAGKGHEQYQDIRGKKIPFSDVAVVQEALKMKAA
ncbi:MAG: UDP-N-acetylmuramoyl-L-alanyl-D-glutamate--2,6-diaminopimelate ligase [Methylococcaceae bacterium]|jgi:UDP-N-acetylmuramoyl-L-alanyl-D-glutamate--2,6-diaminopimelate ligase